MGVNGLWQVLQPCARPTNLGTLNRKRLAVDASIWIYQFLKAVRDKEGNALRNSHVIGFFRRICKLLWFGILPVFVFDGGAPALKRSTLQARRQRREGRREDAVRTAGKLLAVQMHRMAEEEVERKKRATAAGGQQDHRDQGEDGMMEGETMPEADKVVYAEEAHMSTRERLQRRTFTKRDAYHLPDLAGGSIEGMGRPDDPRIMSIDELEEYARQFHAGEDINLYDFSKIDFDGDFFRSLPAADRYYILNAARIRSRLRMGLSKEQLDTMFPDRMAFSRFQIERVQERNHLTQRLMVEAGMSGIDLTMGPGQARIAGDKDREYILVKNEGAEGGWALGVVSRDKDRGMAHKPIDVDALEFRYDGDGEEDANEEDEDEDAEFQDVPIEGLNRLPKLPAFPAQQTETAEQTQEGDEDSLFVTSYDQQPVVQHTAPSTHGDEESLMADEDEDLNRAIAMSLQNQHGIDMNKDDEENDELFEDVELPAPEWKQKAVEPSRPIAPTTTSGQIVAHIVNNRANAAVSIAAAGAKARQEEEEQKKAAEVGKDGSDSSDSSDSELDIRAALAAAAKKKKALQTAPKPIPAPAPAPRPVAQQPLKNPFDGPLPFEKLDWRTSIFEKKPENKAVEEPPKPAAAVTKSVSRPEEDDAFAGGFEREASPVDKNEKDLEGGFEREKPKPDEGKAPPRPLPPWMVDNTDIRTAVRQQRAVEDEINAEDRAMALEEEQMWQRREDRDAVVEIDSSSEDGGSDVEIVEAPKELSVEVSLPVEASGQAKQNEAETAEESDEDVEFEDVAIAQEAVPLPEPEAVPEVQEQTQPPQLQTQTRPQPQPQPQPEPQKTTDVDDLLFTGEGDVDDGDLDFSDPEDEELLVQMAAEVEEHARFASTLNHQTTTHEAQQAYEQELRALRSQQKKDRRDADEVTQLMVAECQGLLRLFGIPYITAPMEAEAQCATLVRLGLVDGIVTDDSDTFLFGGTRVYKNMFNGNKFVECYLAADLERELSLSQRQLISLAQLLGSDYTDGLPGVGPVTAMEILGEFPGEQGLDAFRSWWSDVQNGVRPKEADAPGASAGVVGNFRRKFRKAQATKLFLPTDFPSDAVVEAYLHPEVDRSTEPFQWGVPDLGGLRSYLMATIGWSQERTDEVLVPVIRDMNQREAEGTQSNITRYFSGGVGAGAAAKTGAGAGAGTTTTKKTGHEVEPRHAPRNKNTGSSRRMASAVSRLKAAGAQTETAEEAAGETATEETSRKRKTPARDENQESEEVETVQTVSRRTALRGKKTKPS